MGRDRTEKEPRIAIYDQYFNIGYVNIATGLRVEDAVQWSYADALANTYHSSDTLFDRFLLGLAMLPSNLQGESDIRYFVNWKRRAK